MSRRFIAAWLAVFATSCFAQFGNSPSPESSTLAKGFLDQALAARAGNQNGQELATLQAGLDAVGPTSADAYWFYHRLRQYHSDLGNQMLAMRASEAAAKLAPRPGFRYSALLSLANLRSGLFDAAGAKEAYNEALVVQRRLRSSNGWAERGDVWQAMAAWSSGNLNSNAGHLAEAETSFLTCIDFIQTFLKQFPQAKDEEMFLADCSAGLVNNLLSQGKLAEAGAVLANQKALVDRVAERSQRPAIRARLSLPFVRVAIEQGRNDEARRLAAAAVDVLLAAGAGDASSRVAQLRLQQAQIDMLEGKWPQALATHELRRDALLRAASERGGRGVGGVEYGYTLLRLGRKTEALQMFDTVVKTREGLYDKESLPLWEARAFRGIALAASGQPDKAFDELKAAVPRLLELGNGERTSADAGVLRAARLNWIIDGYLQLLADIAQGGGDQSRVDEAVAEGFRMADLARGSSVQRALAAAASRSTPSDPALAERTRREQDLQNEMTSLADALGNLLARGRVVEQDKVVADMRTTLAKLRAAHDVVRRDLQRRFPSYASLLDPRPVSPQAIQKLLAPDEAMISIYSGADRTLIWAVPAQGPVAFAIAPLGTAAINAAVAKLRLALNPNEGAEGVMPRFESGIAHELYTALLAPVEAGWKNAKKLLLVPHGQTGQLPFSVLLTEPWQAGKQSRNQLPFAELAEAPWLIKRVAVSQLPSALTLPLLRSGRQAPAERAFVGFGDPVFATNAATAANAAARGTKNLRLAAGQIPIPQRRNLAIKPAAAASVAAADVASGIDFNLLAALPDTADEITEVARVLKADGGRDVFLRQRASERNVRSSDLSTYRVVMFATHGLVSGELPGLYQPALALSNPGLTDEAADARGDGMLTMEEILGLRLNAEWVVLSACNTASSNGKGDEAVSGLGRAFFYAGTKAVLVTQWPVETVSARLLTTETFHRQAADSKASRAQVLREASLAVMKQSAPGYSYAHPMFWAPYVLVGDGG